MKNFIGFIHILLILACLTSPWFLDWRIVIIIGILFFLQWVVLGGCILTKWQFGTYKTTMWEHIFDFLKIPVDKKHLRFFTGWILPLIIFLTAIIIQN